MSLDSWLILVELVVGGAGFVLFTYGRRQERLPQLLGGLACLVIPFFLTSLAGLLIGATVVTFGTWWAVRLGW
jgi:hypothetical protein